MVENLYVMFLISYLIVLALLGLVPIFYEHFFQEQQATVVKLQKLFTGKETLVAPGRVSHIIFYFIS